MGWNHRRWEIKIALVWEEIELTSVKPKARHEMRPYDMWSICIVSCPCLHWMDETRPCNEREQESMPPEQITIQRAFFLHTKAKEVSFILIPLLYSLEKLLDLASMHLLPFNCMRDKTRQGMRYYMSLRLLWDEWRMKRLGSLLATTSWRRISPSLSTKGILSQGFKTKDKTLHSNTE